MVNKGPAYRDVRALDRGLRILEILGRKGWTTPRELSNLTAIDRSSAYRLLNTLAGSGYVAKRPEDGSYALTSKIVTIADGFSQNELAPQVVTPHLQQLTKEIKWPSDYAVLQGCEVAIVASTHRISPMTTYRSMIGKKRPLMLSALGRAILSEMTEEELNITLNVLQMLDGKKSAASRLRESAAKIIHEIRQRGYATATGTTDTKISAIALPVRVPYSVIGAVNVIFFRSAMSVVEAADRYLGPLRACVDRIARDLSEETFKASVNRHTDPQWRSGDAPALTGPRRVRSSAIRNNRSS